MNNRQKPEEEKEEECLSHYFFKSLPFGFKYRHKTIPLKKKTIELNPDETAQLQLIQVTAQRLCQFVQKCLSSDIGFHQFEKVILSLKSIFAPLIPHHRVLALNPAPSLFLRCQTYISGLNFTDLNWNKSFD